MNAMSNTVGEKFSAAQVKVSTPTQLSYHETEKALGFIFTLCLLLV